MDQDDDDDFLLVDICMNVCDVGTKKIYSFSSSSVFALCLIFNFQS